MTWIRHLDRRWENNPERRADWQGDRRGREAYLAMIERLRRGDVGAVPPFRLRPDGLWNNGFVMGFWPGEDEAREIERAIDEAEADLGSDSFEFGAPNVCLFDDLTEFRPQFSF